MNRSSGHTHSQNLMGRQKYGRQLWKRLICWSKIVWMSTRLTSTVFAELLQMILPRFLSFDTFASFQTPGGQAVSCKNNRQSGKPQLKVFCHICFVFLFWYFFHVRKNLSRRKRSSTITSDKKMSDKNRRKWSENLVREGVKKNGFIWDFVPNYG